MVEIHPSARKHGIADEDIQHATTNTIRTKIGACISDRLATPISSKWSRSFATTARSWPSTR
jgi:hypothetical protein